MSKPVVLARDTRQWSSGRVRLSVPGVPEHPEQNYIVLEKDFFGRGASRSQRFILRERDWNALKRTVDGPTGSDGLAATAEWVPAPLSESELARIIGERPELIDIVLSSPHLGSLGDASLQALDRLADRLGALKTRQLELIFQRLEETSTQSIDRFADLLDDLRLDQISMLCSLLHRKLRVLDVLEQVVSDPSRSERAVHEIFAANPWLLGKGFEVVQSDRPLTTYLAKHACAEPQLRRRPDLIVSRVPHSTDIVLVELKAPGVKLAAEHVGQVLGYRALVERHKPNCGDIHCFVFGYDSGPTLTRSRDATVKTFAELIAELRDEYAEYLAVLEHGDAEQRAAA